MESWANGGFAAAFTMEMAVKNAGASGACSILAEIADINYDTLQEFSDDK